jgi:hypothetical protein
MGISKTGISNASILKHKFSIRTNYKEQVLIREVFLEFLKNISLAPFLI